MDRGWGTGVKLGCRRILGRSPQSSQKTCQEWIGTEGQGTDSLHVLDVDGEAEGNTFCRPSQQSVFWQVPKFRHGKGASEMDAWFELGDNDRGFREKQILQAEA